MKSAEKLFSVLERLCIDGDAGVTELSRTLGFGKSTTHRFLHILGELGYVRKNLRNGKYFATLKLFTIGAMVKDRLKFVDLARIHIEDLGKQTREAINLAIYSGGKVAYIDKVESVEALRIDFPLGRRLPAYCTAPGKVFLANLPAEELDKYLNETDFKAYTAKTITSAENLKKELDRIRDKGFAIDNTETHDGVRCIAAPIFDELGNVIVAISIAGPSIRLTMGRLKSLRKCLLNVTKEISKKLA